MYIEEINLFPSSRRISYQVLVLVTLGIFILDPGTSVAPDCSS